MPGKLPLNYLYSSAIIITILTLAWNFITLIADQTMSIHQCGLIWTFNVSALCMTLERIDQELKRKACRITLHVIIVVAHIISVVVLGTEPATLAIVLCFLMNYINIMASTVVFVIKEGAY